MARPTKIRKVECFPKSDFFAPAGKPKCEIEVVELKVEEFEAMRLKDIEDLNQEECAKSMEVSRQTFQNIIDSARKKVAVALMEGKAIKICGGHYTTSHCRFKCLECKKVYEINYAQDRDICPECGSEKVLCEKKADFCMKWCNEK